MTLPLSINTIGIIVTMLLILVVEPTHPGFGCSHFPDFIPRFN